MKLYHNEGHVEIVTKDVDKEIPNKLRKSRPRQSYDMSPEGTLLTSSLITLLITTPDVIVIVTKWPRQTEPST